MISFPNHKWLSISILAVIIPVSLLTAFKITGIIPEPPTIAETITVDAVEWNMTRPKNYTCVDKIVENYYDDGLSRIKMYVHVTDYTENSEVFGDCIWFNVNVTAQAQEGFIHSMFIRLPKMGPNAVLYIHLLGPWPKIHNLKTKSIITEGTENHEAYICATRLDQPKSSSIEIIISWHFLDIKGNNLDHWTTPILETIYFNGTVYRKVIIPIKIGVLAS